jgi:uncharacterized membrane protein YeaQ/YmgE (transglycosylase-associated protein family)
MGFLAKHRAVYDHLTTNHEASEAAMSEQEKLGLDDADDNHKQHGHPFSPHILLGLAVVAGVLCCLSLLLAKTVVWAARLVFLPSFVGSIVLLALYAKNSRK